MFSIRTKMIVYSMVLVFLLNGVAYFLYQNSQESGDQYNALLQRFFLLNDLSMSSRNVYDSLNAYLLDSSPEKAQNYWANREKLKDLQAHLGYQMEHDTAVKNYYYLIESFLEECAGLHNSYNRKEAAVFSGQLTELSRISMYIQEATLSLINNELTNYQTFYKDMHRKNELFKTIGISIFTASILLSILFALWFSNGITRPITLLSKAAREISSGKFDGADVKSMTKDELRFLTETFNNMRRNIHRLILEIKQKSELDALLKEMELKSLQNQINPHFLFNTLNTVSKMAYIEGAEKTSDLIDSVGALLRYNLGNLDKPTTLKDEVSVVQEYFFIQQTRFGDRVQFKKDIDETCLSLPIPILTLQPIVENAFIHGVESYESDALLSLHVYRRAGSVVVEVIDNGVGMDEWTKKRLLQPDGGLPASQKPSGHVTGLGLQNVIKRLQLFYGQETIIEIDSKLGEGTSVRLLLPVPAEKEVLSKNHV
ncbi:sensor histidine kinase [Neobacillus notoginsengisoli]|uniref:histidine kinase n=1 Tax=Neobacillus notoginsengisoli TaxID=1578198 RepID=A0A417YYP4_9BACI|nr:sensor histidine kinase [Neobacillus notoginsengisoli]RHW42856.1 sensor histidine kinase [Neobacillus notoginsengisoli]